MIYDRVNKYTFRDAFMRSDNYRNSFSYEGLGALYEYLEQLSDDIGNDIELDPCAIACQYAEYETFEAFKSDYGDKYESFEELKDDVPVLEFPGGFIIEQF